MVHHIFFTRWPFDEHLGWLHVLAVVDNSAQNTRVQVSLGHADFISFVYIPTSRIVKSRGSSSFNFLRPFHTVLNDCTDFTVLQMM